MSLGWSILTERAVLEPEFRNRYDVTTLQLLGSGAWAVVGKVLDTYEGRYVAIKLFTMDMTAELRERIRLEVANAKKIRSHSVVQVDGLYFRDTWAWMQMELVSANGTNLDHLIRARHEEGRPFTPTEALDYAIACTEGVVAAHDVGVIHRDVKPANYLIPDSPSSVLVKLGDFGISKHCDDARWTATGQSPGTPAFMPPEVGRGEPASFASDVYLLSIVLFSIFTTGEYVYDVPAGAPGSVYLNAHLTKTPRRLRQYAPDYPSELEEMLLRSQDKLLADNGQITSIRQRRPQAREVLETLLRTRADMARPVTASRPAAPPPRPWARYVAAAAVPLVVVGAAAILSGRQGADSQGPGSGAHVEPSATVATPGTMTGAPDAAPGSPSPAAASGAAVPFVATSDGLFLTVTNMSNGYASDLALEIVGTDGRVRRANSHGVVEAGGQLMVPFDEFSPSPSVSFQLVSVRVTADIGGAGRQTTTVYPTK